MCFCKNKSKRIFSVYEQRRGKSRVSASCWALQQLRGWRFFHGDDRIPESEPSGGFFGMLLWEKDPCRIWVCSCVCIHFQWGRCKTWKCGTTIITWSVDTVSMVQEGNKFFFLGIKTRLIVPRNFCLKGSKIQPFGSHNPENWTSPGRF